MEVINKIIVKLPFPIIVCIAILILTAWILKQYHNWPTYKYLVNNKIFLIIFIFISFNLLAYYFSKLIILKKEDNYLLININRSEKFYYDNLPDDVQVFHIDVENCKEKEFITDVQIDIELPGPILKIEDYFSKGVKNFKYSDYPANEIATDIKREIKPSQKLYINVEEFKPKGILKLKAFCNVNIRYSPNKTQTTKILPKNMLKSKVDCSYFWADRSKHRKFAREISQSSFTIAELLINDGFFKDLDPEEDFMITFWTKSGEWLDNTFTQSIMFIDLHKKGLEIVLVRDADLKLKLYYSSPYFKNKSLIVEKLSEYDKNKNHFFSLVGSSKGVFLFIDAKPVGSFQK